MALSALSTSPCDTVSYSDSSPTSITLHICVIGLFRLTLALGSKTRYWYSIPRRCILKNPSWPSFVTSAANCALPVRSMYTGRPAASSPWYDAGYIAAFARNSSSSSGEDNRASMSFSSRHAIVARNIDVALVTSSFRARRYRSNAPVSPPLAHIVLGTTTFSSFSAARNDANAVSSSGVDGTSSTVRASGSRIGSVSNTELAPAGWCAAVGWPWGCQMAAIDEQREIARKKVFFHICRQKRFSSRPSRLRAPNVPPVLLEQVSHDLVRLP